MPRGKMASIAERIGRIVEGHRRKSEQIATKLVREIYVSGDWEYVDAYRQFLEALEEAHDQGVLKSRIVGISRQLRRGLEEKLTEDSEKDSRAEEEKLVSIWEAAKIWRSYAQENGQPAISVQGYSLRIAKAIEQGRLSVARTKGRVRYLNKRELESYIQERSSPRERQIQPPAQVRAGEFEGRPAEVYASLRNSGFSKEEIMKRYPHLSQGRRNPEKYFGALEGAYQASRKRLKRE
ncbi:hypothetical protein D6817_04815 [Candidatus Pacearchaeota archaeon]|nr:MAG: hypothetical protein D6817_04815 [Candidatus Pacearchaeota archaeon]